MSLSDHERGLVVVDPPLSGDRNMAIDEAMLAQADAQWPIIIRLYRWNEPTLSIGCFQSLEDREPFPELRDVPWVRRKTGGGAILHDQEWTYSILIPNRIGNSVDLAKSGEAGATRMAGSRNSVKGHSESLYRAVHTTIAQGLQELGWPAQLSEECSCVGQADKKLESFLCFSRRSPVDLVVGRYKILGSAQRRTSSGLLQHGSLLLHTSPFAPNLLGLFDIVRDRKTGTFAMDESDEKSGGKIRLTSGSNAVLLNAASADGDVRQADESNAWAIFLMDALKRGVSSLFPCDWQNASLGELLRS
jgi:lipoyl(octanoyl) transferase